MPSINVAYGPAGPLLQVQIGISSPHLTALAATNTPAPPMVLGSFLVDTGASHTVVDPQLVASLGLTPTGSTGVQTPSTGGAAHSCYQYDVMLHIPAGVTGQIGFFVEAMPVIEASVRPQGIDGLLGRDVLGKCVLISNGPAGILTLCY